MRLLTTRTLFFSSDLGTRNTEFFNRVKSHQKKFKLHQKTKDIKQQDIDKWALEQSKKQLTDKIVKQAQSDFDIKSYIKKFNQQHKGRINLLDFSNYTTKFNDFKDNPISKKDMEVIREFQKRKIDQKLHKLKSERYGKPVEDIGAVYSPLEYQKDVEDDLEAEDDEIEAVWEQEPTGKEVQVPDFKRFFDVDDEFVILLLDRNTSTKVTTLSRINYFRTLLFMGNGNGLIAYGKSRALTPELSMTRAIIQCKKNIIAIPLDKVCTLPRPINSRFQDYRIYLRPIPNFNSYGHPVLAVMLGLTGIEHCGFKTIHTGKNMYTLLHSLFKAVTKNTTPQDMAEMDGFKVYRHRFIRPLTPFPTHGTMSR